MSGNVTLPATGSVIETIDLTGVERQSVTISDRAGGNVDSIGGLTETAPTTDTASSGLNGRLQRIAQRLSSIIALLPTALGTGGGLKVDGSGTALPVSGTVTSNAGTDLNTSALALETGGNLALIAGAVGSSKMATKAASGDFADGAIATLGTKADAKSAATDTTAITLMQVAKQISASVQAPPSQAITAASASVSSGAFAAGSIASGAMVDVGAIADAAVTAGATGSLSAKLRSISRDIVTNIVLAAGTNLIGKVGIDQTTAGTTDSVSVKSQGFAAAVSVTRPANTTAYTANDVVGATAAAWTFPSMGPSGKEIVLTSAALEIDDTALASGETNYRLYLFNVTPPSALADNAAFDLPSGDRASFLGFIDIGLPVDLGSTLYCETNILNKQLTLSGTSLFGYLVTNGGYTPTSARVFKITLHSVAI